MTRFGTRWNAWISKLTKPRHTFGASLFRLVGGVAILTEYLTVYAQRHYLFGPEAAISLRSVEPSVSIYTWSSDPMFFEVAFHLGIVTATLWLLGFYTRWLTPIQLVLWFSLLQRNPLVADGGDNLMSLLLFYAVFADLDQHFACVRPQPSRWLTWTSVRAIAHNASIVAMTIQICIVYAVAGLTKVQGETWRNGTALYYAWQASEFHSPDVSELLWSNSIILNIASYLTVFFQVSFSYLVVLNRGTRVLAAVLGCAFHIAIIGTMGLVTFGLFMVAADLILISNGEYHALRDSLQRHLRFTAVLRRMLTKRRATA